MYVLLSVCCNSFGFIQGTGSSKLQKKVNCAKTFGLKRPTQFSLHMIRPFDFDQFIAAREKEEQSEIDWKDPFFCICCCVAAKKLLYLSWQCLDSSAVEVLWRNCQLGPHEKMYHLLLIYRDHSAKKKDFLASPSNFCFHETFNAYIGCCSDLIYLRLGWVNLSMFYFKTEIA